VNWLLVNEIIERALQEDIGQGDVTTEFTPNTGKEVTARFVAKEPGVLCGLEIAARCFRMYGSAKAVVNQHDRYTVEAEQVFGEVIGRAADILPVERVALNFLQRMSGIASLARRWAVKAGPLGIRVVETRKTTPGLRVLEKYAVRVGGGHNHRFGLSDAVMLKDNHFALGGGDAAKVVAEVKARLGHTMKLVAEAGDPSMIAPLVSAGADVILLDNFTPEQVKAAVAEIGGRVLVEVSGGVNEGNLDSYLIKGVNVISVGALTHSYKSMDISLDFTPV